MPSSVVVLNASFEPLTVVSLHRAMAYLLHVRATIVEAVPGVVIRSATAEFTVPKVVQFREMVRVPYRYRAQAFSSKALFQRDLTCAYCGCDRPDTVDHIVPKSQGGPLTFLNCVAACKRCNNKKANRTPTQAGMPLLYQPREVSKRDSLVLSIAATGADMGLLGLA